MTDAPVLEVSNLVCGYDSHRWRFGAQEKRRVLSGVTFSLRKGECFGLLGDSGSGKSTIASCIAGFTKPESGRIEIAGVNVFPHAEGRRTMKGAVQMLYQDHTASLDPVLTIRQSLKEALRLRRVPEGRMPRMLEDVGLDPALLDRFPGELSGGERQRAALARALAADPLLLVLDEPTSALDDAAQRQMLDLIASIQRRLGMAVLFISHDVEAVARLCSHIAVLCDGCIAETGPAHAVLSHPSHPYTKRIVELYTAL